MVRSKRYADCLPPALTIALHFLFIALLLPYVSCLRHYSSPAFWLYFVWLMLTLGALVGVAGRNPGFVSSDQAKDMSIHNLSYKNTCDKTAGVGEMKEQTVSKGKKKAEDANNPGVYLPSKEDSAKGTENYKYYEFSDPTPINLHTEEDSRVAEDEGKPEIQGEAGCQLHSLDNLPQYHAHKQEIAPISRDIDTEKDKAELDTSEVREIARHLDAVSVSQQPVSGSACEKGLEDVDLTAPGLVVEIRYCVVCKTEQPLRAKHCKDCGVCVALHDHHCPWLGVCIGERTRCFFYVYLCLEAGLMWVTLALVRN